MAVEWNRHHAEYTAMVAGARGVRHTRVYPTRTGYGVKEITHYVAVAAEVPYATHRGTLDAAKRYAERRLTAWSEETRRG